MSATFGARLCAGDTNARDVGCIAVVGDDFPDDLLAKLRSWDLTLVLHQLPPGVKSTRGELTYLDKQFGGMLVLTQSYDSRGLTKSRQNIQIHGPTSDSESRLPR